MLVPEDSPAARESDRVPFGPLPVGMVEPGALSSLPSSLLVTFGVVGVPSITPAQRLRDATAL